jgi:putative NIF3 family GTP cyclohydrolase 1 type 2
MLTVGDVVEWMERFAPPGLAADWDNVGLLLGDRGHAVERLMTCLTVTPEIAAEAVAEKANLIVTHHPILFRGVKRLTGETSEGRMLLELVRANVAVYSPHTAFDNTAGGINDILAARLGLADVVPLRRQLPPREMKVVVFVPDKDLARVSDALFAAGAGHIGQYRECSFRLAGTGTFFGTDASNPTVGQRGRREAVSEWRLEMVCPETRLEPVLTALRQSHSYEEPAFDVYPLQPRPAPQGDGRLLVGM